MIDIPDEVVAQLVRVRGSEAWNPNMLVKTASSSFGATVAGATTTLTIPTQDDNLVRVVIGVWYGGATELVRVQLLSSGRLFSDIDASAFAATHGFQGVFVPFSTNIQIQAALVNGSAGTVAAHAISLRFVVVDPKFRL